MANNVLTDEFFVPLNEAKTARVDIHAGDGNLAIDALAAGEQALASGRLQYFENQGLPARKLDANGDQVTLTLRGGADRRPRFRLPWSACNGATEWQVHLNPAVSVDITAHSDGGNLRLDLAGMAVRRLAADTGGGNLEVALPDQAAGLNVTAKTGGGKVSIEIGRGLTGSSAVEAGSGAGEVVVRIPGDVAARIHATTGLGKVIVDPQYVQVEKYTYQSAGFDSAADRVEIKAHSGAGNVIISTK